MAAGPRSRGWCFAYRPSTRFARSGQQTTEFVIVISVAALAAIGLQFVAQRAIRRGTQRVSDVILGPPLVRPGCLDQNGDGFCDAEDRNRDGKADFLKVDATDTTTEQGSEGFLRKTRLSGAVTGFGEGQEASTRVTPGLKPPVPAEKP